MQLMKKPIKTILSNSLSIEILKGFINKSYVEGLFAGFFTYVINNNVIYVDHNIVISVVL